MPEITPTVNALGETQTDPKTVQFTARVKAEDKNYINALLEPYKVKHEGFSEVVKRLKTPFVKEVEKEVIKEVDRQLKTGEFIIGLQPPLSEKLTNLRRYLKSKNKIPAESTEAEFMQHFIEHAIKNHIEKNYSFLNRD